nr:immunoglobulin heavy chain junction region [Macaca mulatta]MOV48940.1 immunoglobulin heavy chain junction region [Macaca mulatta]MOV49082.1 immunoglobulin heavy chain junction region [Macaca mulatta]MOV49335.1 immunoglobulin heavy chain junction region [Macaca mulatta]MOV49459.1 immunoglobulin heavy chain junction region [Macaca mulatta]
CARDHSGNYDYW